MQLAVSGLRVRFGPLTALDGVDLTVRAGELVALAGENGAGKSTLIRCIAGDITPTSGVIALDGRPVPADPQRAKRQGISVVWQDLALCDNLDIASNVMLGRERRRQLMSGLQMRSDAAAILEQLGVPLHDPERSVRSLSGGQRQLVAVARAMAHQPRLLLLDEPTAALGVQESVLVEELIARVRAQGTTILLACHDISQMFRLADRIAVLRHGQLIAEVAPSEVHPGDVVALLSGQEVDASARRQLTRLHGLTDRAWSELPLGPAGGPVGLAATAQCPIVEEDVQGGAAWTDFAELARSAKVASSWSVPVLGPGGILGVITVFRATAGKPQRDDLDLATLYAGYAASAIERDRLLDEVTSRNRVLETIREMLETLAGPTPVADGLCIALQLLRRGLEADEVALVVQQPGAPPACRAAAGLGSPAGPAQAGEHGDPPAAATQAALQAAGAALARAGQDVSAQPSRDDDERLLSVAFPAPDGQAALVARWHDGPLPADSAALLEDAAHSLRLALERQEAWIANQETAALRRSRELQRGFLSRLSHELRTPLTAIRGYASSLLQTDVTWDEDSEQRFLTRIAAESARLGRLVDDLLRFSAIESGILQLQRDWCDIPLVLDAAIACLPPSGAQLVGVRCAAGLPAIWADHDRLEQVLAHGGRMELVQPGPGTCFRICLPVENPEGLAADAPPGGAETGAAGGTVPAAARGAS